MLADHSGMVPGPELDCLKINFQKSHPQTPETAVGAVVGTDLEQMWVIYLFC